MQPTSENAPGAQNELRSDAQQLTSSAANRLHSELDARKGDAAGQVKSVSSAFERTAGELDDNAPDWLKSAFRQGAQKIQRFADTLEQKDSRQLVREVSSFARENPGTFLAGCAAAGFAASRVFMAGAKDGQSQGQGGFNPPMQQGQADFTAGTEQPFGASPSTATSPPQSRGEFV